MIYRSGELSNLIGTDLELVESFGIRTICDLRSRLERQRFPARWPALAPARVLRMPAALDRQAGLGAMAEQLAHEPGPAGARRAMLAVYAALPGILAPMLAETFQAIASGWAAPLLIHCHAGKDRTGVMVALLLEALGIERGGIIQDYCATDGYLDPEIEGRAIGKLMSRLLGRSLDKQTVEVLMAADPAYLAASYAAIEANFGSLQAYFSEAAGLTESQRDRVKSLMLS